MLLLTGLTTVLFVSSARNEISIIENQEIKNISTISKLIIRGFDSAISEVIFLSELASNYNYKNTGEFLDAVSSFLKSKRYFQKITLVDKDGNILIEIKEEANEFIITPSNQNIKNNIDFRNSLAAGRGHVYVSDFQIDEGVPVLIFGIPVIDRNKKKKAILLVNYNCKPIFDIFRTTFEQKEDDRSVRYARYFIVDEDGYWIKGPKPEDEFGFLYDSKSDRRFGNIFSDAWEKISKDQTG